MPNLSRELFHEAVDWSQKQMSTSFLIGSEENKFLATQHAFEMLQTATGRSVDDAATPAAISLTVGFTPRVVRVTNATTRVMNEWFDGMAADSAIKTVAAGTRTLETSGGITVSGGSITLPAPAQNDVVYWQAEG